MTQEPGIILPGSAAWFCVRTLPKHEHIAAAQLRQQSSDVEVFLPRIRYQRTTRRGPAWVTEALFLNYVFARFDLASRLRQVQAARGVRGVVHFGMRWPTIPHGAIAELKAAMGADEVKTLSQEFQPGDEVEIAGGAFFGLRAVVTRVMPGRQRVAVLLDFLGRQTTVELDRDQLAQNREIRGEPELTVGKAALKRGG
ncbi:MAG TPA: transcription termination/antitermination NusG family protein [Verrucomicrobiae bacterium]|jgi:transcriptional antiterminator RfaH|nr:transcription termination/antitermination NusG family protein [Verrucomicrobiae bacterium]